MGYIRHMVLRSCGSLKTLPPMVACWVSEREVWIKVATMEAVQSKQILLLLV